MPSIVSIEREKLPLTVALRVTSRSARAAPRPRPRSVSSTTRVASSTLRVIDERGGEKQSRLAARDQLRAGAVREPALDAHFLIEPSAVAREHGRRDDAGGIRGRAARDADAAGEDRRAAGIGLVDDHDARARRRRGNRGAARAAARPARANRRTALRPARTLRRACSRRRRSGWRCRAGRSARGKSTTRSRSSAASVSAVPASGCPYGATPNATRCATNRASALGLL